jgi:hypothetical protein
MVINWNWSEVEDLVDEVSCDEEGCIESCQPVESWLRYEAFCHEWTGYSTDEDHIDAFWRETTYIAFQRDSWEDYGLWAH